MRFREHDNQRNRPNDEPSDMPEGNLGESREAGDDLISSTDAAIARALSGDSLQYNRQSQQVGGE